MDVDEVASRGTVRAFSPSLAQPHLLDSIIVDCFYHD